MTETYDYNNRLQVVRLQLAPYQTTNDLVCWVYNDYSNVANPTACSIPSQGTGNDGDVVGQYEKDTVNTSLSHTVGLTYDPTHRLTRSVATGNATHNLTFSYDRYGNMTCQTNGQTQGPCPNYSFSASTNRITTSGFTYDAAGDLTNDGTHSYQYDAEGRLISVDNGTTASYVYNALGWRVEKQVGGTYTEYLFGREGEPVGENNRGTWVDAWVSFQGVHIAHIIGGQTYFAHADRVGTTFMVTDENGNVVQDELHYPWGQEWTRVGTMEEERFARLNHRDSETSLDPTHFRMYSSGVGRWLTPDPVRACPLHPQNFDRYAYVGNSPTNRTDPHGDAVYPGFDYPYIDYGYYPPGYGYDEFDYLSYYYDFVPVGDIVLEGAGVLLCPECDVVVIRMVVAYQLYLLHECEAQYQRDLKGRRLSDPGARSRCYESALNRKNRCEQGWNPLPPLITW